MSDASQSETAERRYDKIEGWLVVVDLGLLLALLRYLMLVLKDLFPGFTREIFGAIFDVQTAAYQRLMAPVSIIEATVHIIFLAFTIVVAVYFNQRRKVAPKLMIAYLTVSLLYQAIFYLGGGLTSLMPVYGSTQSGLDFLRSIAITAIWVTYFKVSKRVQGTFVR